MVGEKSTTDLQLRRSDEHPSGDLLAGPGGAGLDVGARSHVDIRLAFPRNPTSRRPSDRREVGFRENEPNVDVGPGSLIEAAGLSGAGWKVPGRMSVGTSKLKRLVLEKVENSMSEYPVLIIKWMGYPPR